MELLLFILSLLTVGSIIGISMISFRVAIESLKKINSLEKELNESKNELNQSNQEDELYCEYSGLPSPKAYENLK